MTRRRPDHTADMTTAPGRAGARPHRVRRRRRRVLRGVVKTAFWVLVLAGTFVLGLGYGKTLSGEDELSTDKVTVSVPRDAVTATLPERTVTTTVTVPATAKRGKVSPGDRTGSDGP